MKVAGILALILAVAIGIWAATDYAQNETDRHNNQRALQTEIDKNYLEIAEGLPLSDSASQRAKEIATAEQHDAILGIVAAVALIGGIAMISQRKKRSESVSS
jgi:glucose uptake protein GlcU